MPYNLVNRLNRLMEKPFPSQLETENPVLGRMPTTLPEEILEEIDAISDLAREMFGPKIEPSYHQARVLAEQGYPVRPGKVLSGIWQSGFIQTPKGLIFYR